MNRFFGDKKLFFKYWVSVVILLFPLVFLFNSHIYDSRKNTVSFWFSVLGNIVALCITPVTTWIALNLLDDAIFKKSNGGKGKDGKS